MSAVGRLIAGWGLAVTLTTGAGGAGAQTPVVELGDSLPAEPLIGEQFCTTVTFGNDMAPTGYGPYVIGVFDQGMGNATVTFVDVPPEIEFIGQFDASGELIDPISGGTIAGDEGDVAYLARYPVGSLDQTASPILEMDVCAQVLPGTPIGVPLEVEFYPGFEFGDTATGDNGAIIDLNTPGDASTVTPELARLEKTNTAPEDERPPGPSHPFDYVWTMDISLQATIDDLVLTDDLPADILWTGGAVTVTAPQGQGCAATVDPETPGANVDVEVSCDSVTGTGATDDLVVSVPVYIGDVLVESDDNASQGITNTVAYDYTYTDPNSVVTPFSGDDTSDVLAIPAALQKSVSGSAVPGETLRYSVNFQVTDYGTTPGADSFLITDVLGDGLAFVGTVSLLVDGAEVPISPVTNEYDPVTGETTLVWDVGAAYADAIPPGSDGTLIYEAEVLASYADGTPVVAEDDLANDVGLDFSMLDGGTGENPSEAPVTVPANQPSKTLIDPADPMSELMPGQTVTFRLTMDIPAGQTDAVTFTDILPRPVFEATDINPATDIVASPAPFYDFGYDPGSVTIDGGLNAVTIPVGDVVTPDPVTIGVDITVTVSSDPFSDDLYLTNLFVSSYENSGAIQTQLVNADLVLVGAPELVLAKGVVDVDNPAAVIDQPVADPALELADGNATGVDANDDVTYVITVENIGGQNAYNVTVSDPAVAGMSCEPEPDSVVNGEGTPLATTGDLVNGLVLTEPLAGNDENPADGGAPFSTDTALITVSCTTDAGVNPGQQILNQASATWTSTPSGAEFDPVSDDATLDIARPALAKQLDGVDPGYSGTPNASVGEIVTYQLDIVVPEGDTPNAQLNDLLDGGLAFIDVLSIDSPDGITTDGSSDFSGVLAGAAITAEGGAATSPDRRLTLDFGTLGNPNDGNSGSDTVTVTYRAKVLNAAVNTNGVNRRNTATLSWDEAGGTASTQVQANPVVVAEPKLAIAKTIAPTTGDDTTTPTVTITLEHAGNSTAPAFDIDLFDVLPFPAYLDVIPGSLVTTTCDIAPATLDENAGVDEGISATWAQLNPGQSCTLEFQVDILDTVPAGASMNNCADTTWQSLATADQPLDTPPANTLGVERTGASADPGELNNYFAEDCATFQIYDVGIAKTVTSSTEPQTGALPDTPAGAESLTIGEQVVFELVATIPEADVWDLSISDLLPSTGMVLRLDSASTLSVGADLDADDATPTAVITDSNGDGIEDQAVLDYGNIDHTINGTTDDADRIRVQVQATVMDVAENTNNDLEDNTALVSYRVGGASGDIATQTATYSIDLVEPLLQVEKTADVSSAEAGDVVTYTVRVSHTAASRVDAENLALSDELPEELLLVDNSWSTGACTAAPASLDGDVGSNEISASWTSFPLGAVCELTFQAGVDIAAVTGETLTNTADIAWTSLVNAGDPESRPYAANDSWDVVVSLPGLFKRVVATGSEDTPFTLGDPVAPLTIGETVTFLIDAAMPDGTTPEVTVTERLPTSGVVLEIISTELVSVGSDITLGSGITPPAAGTCNAENTECSWTLGEVINQPDTRPDPDPQDQVVFEVQAIVLDDAANSGVPGADDDLPNTAALDSPAVQLQDQAIFDIVEPLLQIDKFTQDGSNQQAVAATEIHRFALRISHTPDSTATARDLVITDTLDSNMLWVDDANVASDCPNWVLDNAPIPDNTGQVTFTIDSLPLSTTSCEITFDVRMEASLLQGFFPNDVEMSWESLPGGAESRVGTDTSSASLYFLTEAFMEKEVVSTSVPRTGDNLWDPNSPDVTIGEIVEYEISAWFGDGDIVDNVTLSDTLDPGLSLVSAELVFQGSAISSTNQDVTTTGNTIEVFYGTVTNVGDGLIDDNDKAVYRVQARVEDVAGNTSGAMLANSALMVWDSPLDPNSLEAEALVDVVEPGIGITKTFTELAEGVASVVFEITNSGDAPAFDLDVFDDMDPNNWEAGSMEPVTVPSGFTFTEGTSPGGDIRLSLAVENPGPVPTSAQVLDPGETLNVEFTMALANGGVLPGVTDIPNTAEAFASSLPDGVSDPNDAGLFVPETERVVSDAGVDTLEFPQLDLTKAWSGPNNPALPGETLTYTLALENSGSAPASDVVISDTPDTVGAFIAGSVTTSNGTVVLGNTSGDASIEVDAASVAAGETVTVTYEVALPYPYPDGMTAPERLINQAAAESAETPAMVSDDPATGAEDDATVVPVIADPIMDVEKDDGIVLTFPGDTLFYTIAYRNDGDQNATGVVLNETVPDNTLFNAGASDPAWNCAGATPGSACSLTIGSLGAGSSGEVVFAVDVDNPVPPAVNAIFNTVDIAEDGVEDPNTPTPPSPPSTDASDEASPLNPLATQPDLRILKNDGGISVVPGQTYFYELVYRNVGTQVASGVFIEDAVPEYTEFNRAASTPGTWICADGAPAGTTCRLNIGLLAPGEVRTARFGLRVLESIPSGVSLISNTASIDDDGTNSAVDQYEESSDNTPLNAVPDIAVEKATPVEQVQQGDIVPYQIEYANLGDQDATGVVVRELVPPGTRYSEADSAPTVWSCPDDSGPGTVCTYDVGDLAAGAGGTLQFALRVTAQESDVDNIVNIVEANDDGSNGADPNPSNNADNAITPFPIYGIPVMSWQMLLFYALMLMAAGGWHLRLRHG